MMYVLTWWIEGPFRLEGEKESILEAYRLIVASKVKANPQVFDDLGNELDPNRGFQRRVITR